MKHLLVVILSCLSVACSVTLAEANPQRAGVTNTLTVATSPLPVIKGPWFMISPSDPVWRGEAATDYQEKRRIEYFARLEKLLAGRNPAADVQQFTAKGQYFLLPTRGLFGRFPDPILHRLKQSMRVPGSVFHARCPLKQFQGTPNNVSELLRSGTYESIMERYALQFDRLMLAACIKKYKLDQPLK